MGALNERLQAKGTKTRPDLEGWIEKGGKFSLAVTSIVAWRFRRTTRLSGIILRDGAATVIRGKVSGGVAPEGLRVLVGALVIVFVALVITGNPMLALVTLIFGGLSYVPLRGDFVNSETLLIEVEKTLGATPRPPKE